MRWIAHYEKLIEKRRENIPEGYTESHHILPTCMEGLDVLNNLVRLTAKEHLLAHLLLAKMHGRGSKLWYAARMMSNFGKYGSRRYAWLKENFSMSETWKKNIWIGIRNSPSFEERNEKISHFQKGRVKSEEECQKLSENHMCRTNLEKWRLHQIQVGETARGKTHDEQWCQNISAATRGKKKTLKIRTCPHCGMEGSGGGMNRNHFNQCKVRVS
jgi:hypothetical protein